MSNTLLDRIVLLTTVRIALPLALFVACATPAQAQTTEPDGVATLLNRVEQLLQQNDRDTFPSLLSPSDVTGDVAEQVTDDLFSYETTRAVVRERDRELLMSALPGDGYRVIVEILTETAARARVMTARLDLKRPHEGALDSWRIVGLERLTFVQGLYRLRIDSSTQFVAREFTIQAQDVQFTLHTGYVFQVISGDGQVRYRVRVSGLKTRDEALRTAERVRADRSLPTYVTAN